MPVEVLSMTDVEIRTFEEKLESFGNQLSAKEQRLFGEILMRAAALREDADVEGHAIALPAVQKPSWPEIRKNLGSVIMTVLVEIGKNQPHSPYPPYA